jgi:YD repeat-containing protein
MAANGLSYVYDSLGRRTRAIDGLGHVTLYYYDREGQLVATVDAKGEVTELIYNGFGALTTQRRYAAVLSSAQLTTLTSVAGGGGAMTSALTTMLAGLRNVSLDQSTTFDYDQRGLLTTQTNAADMGSGLVTTMSYDLYGQLQKQTRTIDATRSVTTEFDRDLDGRLVSTTADLNGLNFNSQVRYDAFGRTTRTIDALGRITSRTEYKDNGRTIEVKDVFSLDAQGNEVPGHLVHAEYNDFAGRVTKVIDVAGKTTAYAYREADRSMTVTTPEGVVVTTVTTREGETLSVTHGTSVATYAYDRDGQLLTVTDGLGHTVTRNHYDLKTGLRDTVTDALGVVTSFTYDVLNRVFERRVDPSGLNLVCKYEFDALGQQIRVTEGHGDIDSPNTGANVTQVTKVEYDQAGRQTKIVVDPDGLALSTKFEYDTLGNTIKVSQGSVANQYQFVTQYLFDNLGRRTAEIVAPGDGSAREHSITTRYIYDLAGNLTRKIDAGGFSTWYVYDRGNQLTQTIDAAGEVTENTYSAKGQLTQTRGYVNRLSSSTVAAFGDAVGMQSPGVDINDARTVIVYDDDGRARFTLQASTKLFGDSPSGTPRPWTIGEQRYDLNGNVSETRRYDQYLDESRIEADDTASSPGISVAEMTAELTTLGYTSEASLANVARTRFVYDAANRLSFTVDALGDVSQTVLDDAGNVIEAIRYAKRPTITTYDAATISQLVDRTDINNQDTHYTRDKAGRLRFTTRVVTLHEVTVNGMQDVTHYVVSEERYDDVGRVTEMLGYATPYTGISDYSETALATTVNQASSYRAQDRRTIIAYDKAGRATYTLQVSSNNASGQPQRYIASKSVYDDLSHVVMSTAYAKEIASPLADDQAATIAAAIVTSDQDRTTELFYDPVGRVRFVIAPDKTLRETLYDSLSRVVEDRQFDLKLNTSVLHTLDGLVAFRAGRYVGDGVTRGNKYTYDSVGRLLRTTDARGYSESNQYDAFGNRTVFIDKNGNQWNYTYHRDGKLREEFTPFADIQLSNETAPVHRRLSTVYAYNAVGTLASKTEAKATVDARATFYTYDQLGRLIQLDTAVYDPDLGHVVGGNKTKSTQFWRGETTTYDALGNIVRTGVRTGPNASDYLYQYKTYNALGQVVFDVDALHQVTKYEYTAFGDPSAVTRFSVEDIGLPSAPTGGGLALWTTKAVSDKVELDAQGRLTTDPNARRTQIGYDTMGRKVSVTQPQESDYYYTLITESLNPASITPVTAQATTTFEYNSFGEVFHEKQPLDNTRSKETWHYYDLGGREIRTLTLSRPPDHILSDRTEAYDTARSYDNFGNLQQVIEYAKANRNVDPTNSLTPPAIPSESTDDRITVYSYDALNRNTKVERLGLRYTAVDGAGHYTDVSNSRTTATTVSQTTYDPLGHARTQTDALGNVTTMEYNELGELTRITAPAHAVAGSSADPFLSQATVSPVTTFTYNAYGLIVATIQNPGTGAASRVTVNHYDIAGNLTSITDANHAQLDGSGNIVIPDPSFDTVLSYDYAGRLLKQTQHVVSQIGVRSTDGFQTNLVTWRTVDQYLTSVYAYDAAGHRTDVLQLFKDADGVTLDQSGDRSLFNAFGQVKAEQKVWGTAAQSLASLSKATVATYTYDKNGQRKTMSSASGETDYFYDLAGNLTRQEARGNNSTADGTGTRVTEMAYDFLGRLAMTRLPAYSASVASGAPLLTPIMIMTYDRWGNVTDRLAEVLSTVAGTSTVVSNRDSTYQYNADNKLIAESHGPVPAIDVNGNVSNLSVTHATHYDLLGHAVQEIDLLSGSSTTLRVHSQLYDAAGNLSSETTGLATDSAGVETTSYLYDSFGNRVATKNSIGNVFVDTFDANGNQLTHSILRPASNLATGIYTSNPSVQAAAVLLTRRVYDTANRVVALEEYHSASTNGLGTGFDATYTQYDERGFTVATLKELEARFNDVHNAPFSYGLAYGGIRETSCVYDLWGAKVREQDALGIVNTSTYDRTVDPADGSSPSLLFGQLKSIDLGQVVANGGLFGGDLEQFQYNDFGQVKVQGFAGGFTNARSYVYYENGLTQSIAETSTSGNINANGYVHTVSSSTYGYNGYGELASERNVSSGVYTDWWKGESPDLVHLPDVDRTTTTTYDAAGNVKTVQLVDNHPASSSLHRADGTITYDYDAIGNRRRITSVYTPGSGVTTTNTDVTWNEYDSEGRITLANRVNRNGQSLDHGTSVLYDGLGRRTTATTQQEGRKSLSLPVGNTTKATGFINADGTPQIGIFPTNDVYSWDEWRTERYTYNDLGQLTLVEQQLTQTGKQMQVTYDQGVLSDDPGTWVLPPPPETPTPLANFQTAYTKFSERTYDFLGLQSSAIQYVQMQFALGHDATDSTAALAKASETFFQYDSRGFLSSQFTNKYQDDGIHVDGKQSSSTTYTQVDNAGLVHAYTYVQGNGGTTNKVEDGFTSNYTYHYTYAAGAWREAELDVTSNLSGSQPGKTVSNYNLQGELVSQAVDDPTAMTRDRRLMAYDGEGRVIAKDDHLININTDNVDNELSHGAADYIYSKDLAVGTIGSNTLADSTQFAIDFTPVSAAYPLSQPGNHTVTPGDTLAGLARLYYGDPQLWYLIADANGVTVGPTAQLPSSEYGRVYRIPNVVASVHSNAGTSQPYNLMTIVGSSTPNFALAPPPNDLCAQTTGALVGATVAAAVIIAAAILTEGVGAAIAAGAISGFAGNASQQLTEIGISDRKSLGDFSGVSLFQATAMGAAGAGLGVGAAYAGGGSLIGQVIAQSARAGAAYTLDAAQSHQFSGWDLLANMSIGAAGALVAPATAATVPGFDHFRPAAILQSLLVSAFNPNGWAVNAHGQNNWASMVSGLVSAFGSFYSKDGEDGPLEHEAEQAVEPAHDPEVPRHPVEAPNTAGATEAMDRSIAASEQVTPHGETTVSYGKWITLTEEDDKPETTAAREYGDPKLGPALYRINNSKWWKPNDRIYIPDEIDPQFAHDALVSVYKDEARADTNNTLNEIYANDGPTVDHMLGDKRAADQNAATQAAVLAKYRERERAITASNTVGDFESTAQTAWQHPLTNAEWAIVKANGLPTDSRRFDNAQIHPDDADVPVPLPEPTLLQRAHSFVWNKVYGDMNASGTEEVGEWAPGQPYTVAASKFAEVKLQRESAPMLARLESVESGPGPAFGRALFRGGARIIGASEETAEAAGDMGATFGDMGQALILQRALTPEAAPELPPPVRDFSRGRVAAEVPQPDGTTAQLLINDAIVPVDQAPAAATAAAPPVAEVVRDANGAIPMTPIRYSSVAEAGYAAATEANSSSVPKNLEFGARLFRTPDGSYVYTGPWMGGATYVDIPRIESGKVAGVPDDWAPIGDAHAHADYSVFDLDANGRPFYVNGGPAVIRTSDPNRDDFQSDQFSANDQRRALEDSFKILDPNSKSYEDVGYRAFLGTPSGQVKVYNPATGQVAVMVRDPFTGKLAVIVQSTP